MNQLIKVHGFVRSGNHALSALLHRAFFPSLPGMTVDNRNTGHWSQRAGAARYEVDGADQGAERVHIPYADVLGTHNMPRGDTRRVVYVVRDGRDVALSMYRWKKMAAPGDLSFSEWVRQTIDWWPSPGKRAEPADGYTVWRMWLDHVTTWATTDALVVRYEDLVRAPGRVVESVAHAMGIVPVVDYDAPGMTGWNASKRPRVGGWLDDMGPDDVALFDSITPPQFIGRWHG